QTNYGQGLKEGPYQRWYNAGQLEEEGVYRAGKREGRRTVWYRDGLRKFEGSYVNGKLHGEARYYGLDGKLRYILLFQNSVMTQILEGRMNYELDNLQGSMISVEP
ncbi:MAG TPA: hypothetical protein PLP17_10235, partial [Oligoflexia bacterium]|nr:hypothetical protein [Oligoflexia bacterium]